MTRQYFGTDGVRGKFGDAVMNPDFVRRLAQAAGLHVGGKLPADQPRYALIGRDTRASGVALESAVAAGLAAAGWNVGLLGVVPTPAVSLAVRELGAQLGVVITASHNPAEDNGVKFFAANGHKLPDAEEAAIETRLDASAHGTRGAIASLEAGRARYVQNLAAVLPAGALAGWKIVLDTANGATCETSREVLRALGADLILLGNAPDGSNINAGVGSEHPGPLADRVRTSGARLGIAHDGDGDRAVFCDETGSVLDGDEVLTFLALAALQRGELGNRTLVVTVQSNLGVDAAVSAAGGRVVRTNVGDRYVSEALHREGSSLGGESSGHFIFPRVSPAGDGLLAALAVLRAMQESGKPLSELRRALAKFPQKTKNLKLRAKPALESLRGVQALLREAEAAFAGAGRVMIRYSGTEAKIRLLVEARNDAEVATWLARAEAAVRADLQVVD